LCKVLLVATVLWPHASLAQQVTATIMGTITDESGAAMPGVTVTATSPALQVPSVSGVSDERGEYRLTPLPIGTYAVEYQLSGFQSQRRQDVRLGVGFTARVDIVLKVGALEETVTVSGVSPVVDTTSTTATTQFTRESIEILPTSRNGIVSLLSQAPGVRTLRDVGGSSINQVPTYRVFGQAGEPFATLEGVQTSSLQASGGQANYWDYMTIEEASIRTIGNSAEVPSRGINLTAIVKSGGNDFHGSGWLNYTSSDLQSDNVDDSLRALGVDSGARLVSRHSFSGDLGGRLIRNKLWFYVASRRAINESEVINTFKPDGSPAVAGDVSYFYTQKVSYQMSASNRLVAYHQFNHKNDLSNLDQFRAWDYRGGLMTPSRTAKLEWQKLYGSTAVTSFQYGFWTYDSIYYNYSPRHVPPSTDLTTLINRGPQVTVGQRPHNPRHHYKGSLTWYKPNAWAGKHEFKVGFDYTDNWFGRQYPALPGDLQFHGAFSSAFYNYRLVFDSSPTNLNPNRSSQIEVWNNPGYAKVVSHYLGTYLVDSWTVGRRLTLNLGLRYAHDNGFVPNSCREAADPPGHIAFPAACYDKQQFNVWSSVAPRIHGAYDLFGNGRTMIKGGWGRFDHQRQQVPELDAADPQVRTQVVYRWRDLNLNGNYDAGEVNLDPNGPDFISQSGGTNTVPSPSEVQPKSDEFSMTVERELAQNFGLRVSGVYSKYRNTYRLLNALRPYEAYNIPLTRPDPGPDGVVGNADDPGVNITYFEFAPELAGRRFERFSRVNDRRADQTFKSIDMALFKRLSQRWQLMASYSATKRNVPIIFSNQTTQATTAALEFNGNVESGPLTPNAEINTHDRTWEWSGKVSGAYLLPYQLLFSANFEHRSGIPYARQVLFRGGRTIPNITLNVEPFGTRRLPNTNQLDIRVEKSFKLTAGHKLAVRFNVFNFLNSNTVTDLVKLSGARFGLPTEIMPPRIAEFSTTYSF
jgi:hypothetical protein